MKTKLFITTICLSILFGCSKDKTNSEVQPKDYSVLLHISRPDGSSYFEGEVEARPGYVDEEGKIEYYGDWSVFRIEQNFSDQMGEKYFGPFHVGTGIIEGAEPEQGTITVNNQILLLRYEGSQQIDTIRAKDSLLYPEFRYFDMYKNDNFIKRFNVIEDANEEPWFISINN